MTEDRNRPNATDEEQDDAGSDDPGTLGGATGRDARGDDISSGAGNYSPGTGSGSGDYSGSEGDTAAPRVDPS